MKKISEADLVLNVICTEQNLPQEKVMLSLKAVGIPKRVQFHMAYELVKLLREGEVVRMSGRRGVYCLADVLYADLSRANRELLDARAEKQYVDSEEGKEHVCHTVAAASMKYSLLCISPRMEIAFDVAEAVDLKGNSAVFILYSEPGFSPSSGSSIRELRKGNMHLRQTKSTGLCLRIPRNGRYLLCT
jgi:arginyl-tRNA synthetase